MTSGKGATALSIQPTRSTGLIRDPLGRVLEKSDVGVYAYQSAAHPGAAAVGGQSLGGLASLLAILLFLGRGARRSARASLAVSVAFLVASCACGPPGPPAGTLLYVVNHLGSTVAQLDVDSKVVGESNFDVWGGPIALTAEAPMGSPARSTTSRPASSTSAVGIVTSGWGVSSQEAGHGARMGV